MFEWAYSGVNASIPRNVGPECTNFLTPQRRIWETMLASVLIGLCLRWGYKRIVFPKAMDYGDTERTGKKILLVMMTLCLGIEIGFKFTSRTMVYLLNPCHVTTAVQVKNTTLIIAVMKKKMTFCGGNISQNFYRFWFFYRTI